MKLFTKDINQKLFAQYRIGSNLNEQNVVAKIFNPYGIGRWYLLNSDPNEPDYLWAIVQMGDVVEVGSVLRSELESIRVKPFGLPLERDLYFSDRNAMEILDGLEKGKTFAKGGEVIEVEIGDKIKSKSGIQGEVYESDGKVFKLMDNYGTKSNKLHFSKDFKKLEVIKKEMADGGKLPNGKYKYEKGDEGMYQGDEVRVVKYRNGERIYEYNLIDEDGKVKTHGVAKAEKFENQFRFFPKMAKGGGIYTTDSLYYLQVIKDDKEVAREKFRAKSLKEAKEISEEEYESNYISKYGNPLNFIVSEAMEEGGKTLESIRKEIDERNMKIRFKIATIIGLDKAIKYLDMDYVISPFKLIEASVSKGFITIDEIDENLWDAARYEADEVDSYYRGSGQGIGSSDVNAFVSNMLNSAGIKVGVVDGRYTRMAKGGKLIGNQKKLDVNKNGKLDAEDFKMLRGKMAKGGYIVIEGFDHYKNKPLYQVVSRDKDSEFVGVWHTLKEDAENEYKSLVGNWDDEVEIMAMGGKVKFADKVKEVKASLLKRKKVSPSVQKDYGKTYSPKEAEESAKRIIGAQVKKYEVKKKFKKGGKTIAQTPAPKKDRVYGSSKNKVGSASSQKSAMSIKLDEDIVKTLTNKAKEYNEKHSSKVSTSTLKAVMRRGMGAYSTSHRPTISGGAPNSRQAWGFARVNKFLLKKGGTKVKKAYVQDDDLLK